METQVKEIKEIGTPVNSLTEKVINDAKQLNALNDSLTKATEGEDDTESVDLELFNSSI